MAAIDRAGTPIAERLSPSLPSQPARVLMLHTMSLPDSDSSAPPVAVPYGILELASAEQFVQMFERRASRSRRVSDGLSALRLHLHIEPTPGPPLCHLLRAEIDRRLCRQVRSIDEVARWETTQYGVLIPGCAARDAQAVLYRLAASVGGTCLLGGRLLRLRISGEVLVARADTQ